MVGRAVAVIVLVATMSVACGPGSATSGEPDPGAASVAPAAMPFECGEPPERPSAAAQIRGVRTAAIGAFVPGESTGLDEKPNGRVRVCIDGADAADLVGDIVCGWNLTRSSLLAISGTLDGNGREMEVVATVVDGGSLRVNHRVGDFRSGPAGAPVAMSEDDRSGWIGPVSTNGQPGVRVVVRWACEPPPPPEPGLADGELHLQLDAGVGGDLATRAICRWGTDGDRPVVSEVFAFEDRFELGPDRFLAATVQPPVGPLSLSIVELYVTDANRGRRGDYTMGDAFRAVALERSADGMTGRLRVRGLEVHGRGAEGQTLDGTEQTRTLSATLGWRCEAPAVRPARQDPANRGEVEPGRLALTLIRPHDHAVEGPAQCSILPNGTIASAWGTVDIADERWVIEMDPALVLVRIGPDGRVVGEYEHDGIGAGMDDVEHVIRNTILALEPAANSRIAPAQLDGAAADKLALTSVIDCG